MEINACKHDNGLKATPNFQETNSQEGFVLSSYEKFLGLSVEAEG